jgi:hypothetical protein
MAHWFLICRREPSAFTDGTGHTTSACFARLRERDWSSGKGHKFAVATTDTDNTNGGRVMEMDAATALKLLVEHVENNVGEQFMHDSNCQTQIGLPGGKCEFCNAMDDARYVVNAA